MDKIIYYKDIFFTIKSYLENKDIIELITTSKNMNNGYGKTNIFTSIYIDYNMNVVDYIKRYINNKKSVLSVIINRIKDPILYWPFDINTMIFVNCNVDKKYVEKHYKTKNIIIVDKYSYYHWH
jgi:hypothetical protein